MRQISSHFPVAYCFLYSKKNLFKKKQLYNVCNNGTNKNTISCLYIRIYFLLNIKVCTIGCVDIGEIRIRYFLFIWSLLEFFAFFSMRVHARVYQIENERRLAH